MSEVKLEGITKRYEGVEAMALESLDLAFASGELTVLVGPSGCGKSTTLRIVAGLEAPTTGRVSIGGRDVTQLPPAERDIAMVFQSYALYPHMTVFENLAFALRIRKRSEKDIRAQVERVARSLGIESYLDRRPVHLSGGQRQRVAIGRAVVREPKVFLFDEPLSNLDAKLRGEMRREIARIHNLTAEISSLYVTHDQVEAMTLADRIVVLDRGVVQQVGTPIEIYRQPANRFVAGFFGTPAMNFLSAAPAAPAAAGSDASKWTARGRGFALEFAGAPPSSELILGVRPENLGLHESPGASALRAEVTLREVLGPEVLLHLRCDAGELVARVDANAGAREGDHLTFWISPAAVHVFDAVSEKCL